MPNSQSRGLLVENEELQHFSQTSNSNSLLKYEKMELNIKNLCNKESQLKSNKFLFVIQKW